MATIVPNYTDQENCEMDDGGIYRIYGGQFPELASITVNTTQENEIDTFTLDIAANPLFLIEPTDKNSDLIQEQTRVNDKRVDVTRTVRGQFVGVTSAIGRLMDALNANCQGYFLVVVLKARDAAGERKKIVIGLDITDPATNAFAQTPEKLLTRDGFFNVPTMDDEDGPRAEITLSDMSRKYGVFLNMDLASLDALT